MVQLQFELLFLASLFNYDIASGWTCLHCERIEQPRHCRTVARCEQGEVCGSEGLPSVNGFKYYKLGCVKQSSCLSRSDFTNSTVCSQCCTADLCNANACGNPGYPSQRGPICYSCQYNSEDHLCRNIEFCSEDEACSLLGQEEFGDVIYRTECKLHQSCQKTTGDPSAIVGKRRSTHYRSANHVLCDTCCSDDLCNLNCSFNHCYSSPCLHGICSSDGSSFTCQCNYGWGGSRCDQQQVTSAITTASTTPPTTTDPAYAVHNCKDIKNMGLGNTTGVYKISVDVDGQRHLLDVYCDMQTDGGGWTVFQKRFDGSVDFYQNFTEYENGFGNLRGEFWLGLRWVYYMTKSKQQELRIDMVDTMNQTRFAKYANFSLGSPPLYRLHVSGFSGTAANGLDDNHNGMAFSTKDRDNDRYSPDNCAVLRQAGYWFNACSFSNLNGNYHIRFGTISYSGFYWPYRSISQLSESQMKFR